MTETGGLLVITAHPDDEALVAGGTLAACAQAGVRTAVLCLTRGELGGRDEQVGPALGRVRHSELHAACAVLEVGEVIGCRHPDGELDSVAPRVIRAQIADVLAMRRPEIVITFGPDGLYWHPDHVVVHERVSEVLRGGAAVRRYGSPQLYEAAWPSAVSVALVAALRARRLPCGLWDIPPEDFGIDELDGALPLDVSPHAVTKLEALRCHRSQIDGAHAFAQMPADLAREHLGREWFRPGRPGSSGLGPLAQLCPTRARSG